MQSAPLWDPVQCQFVGLLTVTDFIDILHHYRASGKDVGNLAFSSIAEILSESGPLRPFRGADCTCTLKQACHQLLKDRQDFLPIVFADDMRVLACITFTNILEHLVTHFREQRRLFDDSVTDLRIGTYGNDLVTVTPQQTLADALQSMIQHNLSALPVIDPVSRKVLGVYSRSDITFLTKATDAEDAVRNLELPLSEVLAQTRQDVTTPDALRTCTPSHTLQAIFESFAHVRFHRLFIVDPEDRLLGVVSAKDLVAYFLSED
jgi:5'-AMP-activated protein kinase, regulatory gamma subunit